MKKIVSAVLFSLIASSTTLGQSPPNPPTWRIAGQVNGNRIEFKCLEGCDFLFVGVGCNDFANCSWTLDQSGIGTPGEPFDIPKGREEAQERQ